MILLFVFIGLVALFLILDFGAFISGGQTMSQFVILMAHSDAVFCWCVVGILVILPVLLAFHFELFKRGKDE